MSDLSTLFQVSVSVFCIISTVTSLAILVAVILFYRQLSHLTEKLEELVKDAKSTTDNIKSFVNESVQTVEEFKKGLFTLEIIKNIGSKIVNKFVNKTEGEEDGGQK